MNEEELLEVKQNKAIRGYILRSLVKGFNNTLYVRQIANSLVQDGMIVSPDIARHLDYLESGNYIEFSNARVSAYNAYKNDAIIRLTKAGIDLVEGTISDAGVDI